MKFAAHPLGRSETLHQGLADYKNVICSETPKTLDRVSEHLQAVLDAVSPDDETISSLHLLGFSKGLFPVGLCLWWVLSL